MDWVWVLVGLALTVLVILPLISTVSLMRIRLLPGGFSRLVPSELPESYADRLIAAEKFLLKNNFSLVGRFIRSPLLGGQALGAAVAVYRDEASGSYALGMVDALADASRWKLMMLSPLENGGWLYTADGEENCPWMFPPDIEYVDVEAFSHKKHLAAHRQMLGDRQPDCSREMADSDWLILLERIFLQGEVESGAVRQVADKYGLTFRAAWDRRRRAAMLMARRKEADNEVAEDLVVRDDERAVSTLMAGYHEWKQVRDANRGGWSWPLILGVSVLLFAASFGIHLSLMSVLVLVVVLLIHESGHLFGMWLFGYKDLKMLFIPFLGALAMGEPGRVRAWKESVILLLGPAPGLILGITIIVLGGDNMPSWLFEGAMIAIILNGFNLLPFTPLDGGRLVQLALFCRHPFLQFGFQAFSACCMLMLGFLWGEKVLMFLGAFLILGLPAAWREASVSRFLLRTLPDVDEPDPAAVLGLIHQRREWKVLQAPNNWALLETLKRKVEYSRSALWERSASLTAWAALIVLPVYFTLGATGIQVAFQLASGDLGIGYAGMHHAELIRQLEDAEVPEDRLEILSVLIMRHSLEGEDASPFWPTFQQEIRALPETSIERIRYQRSLAHLCRQFEPSGCGAGYLRDALSLALAAGPEQEIFVHQIWNDLIVIQPSAEAALSEWNSAYTNATGRKDMEWQVDLLMLQGRLLVQAADIPRAEQSYRRAWEIAEGLDDVWVLQSAGTEQAGFYLAQGNKTAAYQVMQAQCARETARDREEVGLALSACYRLAKQRGIEEAGLALALLEPLSFAAPESQLELVMARLMLSGESPPLSEAAAEQLRSAQKKLQNEWQWYALAENLLLGSESVSSNDPSSESFRITGFTPVSGDWDMAFQEYARQLPGTKPLNEALATLEFEYAELD